MKNQAEIIVQNGRITDIKPTQGHVSINTCSQAPAWEQQGILYIPNTFIYKGFKDCHGHVPSLGSMINGLSLNNASSPEECIEISRHRQDFRGDWLYGTGWNEELWSKHALPSKDLLDEAYPDIPVYFMRIDYHAAWVNSTALKIAGIDRYTPDPEGGSILKDKSGSPSGILLDNAMEIIRKMLPKPDRNQTKKHILDAVDSLASKGLTEVHDLDLNPYYLDIMRELNSEGKLKIRLKVFVSGQDDQWLLKNITPHKFGMVDVCGVKLYADGALGSRGAALLEPYHDDQTTKGLLILSNEQIYRKVRVAVENGWQVGIHAIGDAACRQVIRTYARVRSEKIADDSTILRLEHAQTLHPDDIPIIADNGIIASVQPIHCISDARMADKRLGSRCSRAYLWKSLLDAGIPIMAGSDFPIESHDPLIGIDALVRRVPFGETDPWYPDERISIVDAIKIYSDPPASLLSSDPLFKPGDTADFTILDQNLYEIDPDDILKTKVVATVVDGKLIEN